MKKNFIKFLFVQSAFDGNTIDLGKVWSHTVVSIDTARGESRQRPGNNNGLFQFLVDDMNNSGSYIDLLEVKRSLERRDGKFYTAILEFLPREAAQTTNPALNICDNDGSVTGYKYEPVSFGKQLKSEKFKISDAFLRCVREGKDIYKEKVFLEKLRKYLDKLGKEVATGFMQGNYVGNFAKGGGNTCKDLPLFVSAGNTVNYTGEAVIEEDMLQAETGGIMPVLIGGTKVSQYAKMREFVVANNTLGIDIALRNDMMAQMGSELMFYRDTTIGNVTYQGGTNPDRAIAIIPGAVKLVTMALNEGDFAYESQTQMRGTYVDPFYGLTHDVWMNIHECADNGVDVTMQFGIIWDIVGYPDCWAEDDDFAGVKDVYCYNITCSDEGICGIAPETSNASNVSTDVEPCGPGATPCEQTCRALFISTCNQQSLFRQDAIVEGLISAVSVNGMNFNLGAIYDVRVEAEADALTVALRAALAGVGSILQISGGWESAGGDAEYYVVAETSVTSFILIADGGADIDLIRDEAYFVNVRDNSTVSTGADYATTALNWTAPDATAFAGTPSDSIFSSVTTGHYGVMKNFYAEVAEGGTYVLDLVDSLACTANYSAETEPCQGLTFEVPISTFTDTNANDLKDGGEVFIGDIKLLLYAGITQTTLVDTIITDGGGLATFNLEAGVYNVTFDATYGNAINKDMLTVVPKYLEVAVNGDITYGVNFSEDALFPVGIPIV
jgi:hypothetical protein